MATDTSAQGLETLIVRHMTGTDGAATMRPMFMPEPPLFDELMAVLAAAELTINYP